MNHDEQITVKRFEELRQRSFGQSRWLFTDFLNMNEQSLLLMTQKEGFCLFGGYEGAERQIAAFGSKEEFGYEEDFPIACIKTSPLQKKFSDELTHRDFLGSVLGLGIKRETVGDIIVKENEGYIFCLEPMADYIIDNLYKIKHTDVKCKRVDRLPEILKKEMTEREIVLASARLDAAVGGVYNLSRSIASELVKGGKVFVNSKLTENPSFTLKEGDAVSVRGYGRFIWVGIYGETRKGRAKAVVKC